MQVSLPSDTPVTSVAVPRDALVERGGQSYLYKVNDEGAAEQIAANEATWLDQIRRVFDVGKAEVRHNSEWLDGMGLADVVKLAGQLTVAQMLERDSFAKRLVCSFWSRCRG